MSLSLPTVAACCMCTVYWNNALLDFSSKSKAYTVKLGGSRELKNKNANSKLSRIYALSTRRLRRLNSRIFGTHRLGHQTLQCIDDTE